MKTIKSAAFQLSTLQGLFYGFENRPTGFAKIAAACRKLSSSMRRSEFKKIASITYFRKKTNGIVLNQAAILKAFGAFTSILVIACPAVVNSLSISAQSLPLIATIFSAVFCLAICVVLNGIKKEFNVYQNAIIQQNETLLERNTSLQSLVTTGEQEQEKLKRTILLKERLISIISHDVRVPFNAFKFLIECYENGFVSQEAALAGIIETKNDLVKTDNMIVDLVSFARNGKSAADVSTLSFQQCHNVMESVMSIYTLSAKNKNLDIVPIIDMPENSSLSMNKRDVEVIIRNLLSNAIKYSNNGGKIIVSLKAEGNNATLKVQDFGKGMSESILKKLCSNKVISSMGTQDEIGLGIGLNIIYDVINDYNLTYDVKSKIDCGTEFSLQLPMITC